MASTHTWDNVNYADAFNASMTGIGLLWIILGVLFLKRWNSSQQFQKFMSLTQNR